MNDHEKECAEISDAVMKSMMLWIDSKASDMLEKRMYASIVGKELLLLGANFLGNSMNMDSNTCLGLAKDMIAKFRLYIDENRERIRDEIMDQLSNGGSQ